MVMALSCRRVLDSLMVIGESCGRIDVNDVPAVDGTIVGSAVGTDMMLSCCCCWLLLSSRSLLCSMSMSSRFLMLLTKRCLMSSRLLVEELDAPTPSVEPVESDNGRGR